MDEVPVNQELMTRVNAEDLRIGRAVGSVLKVAIKGFVIAFVVVFPFSCAYGFWQASGRQKYIRATASHAQTLSRAWMIYSTDFDDHTCGSKAWNESLKPYYKDAVMLEDANIETGEKRGIGINPGFDFVNTNAMPVMSKSLTFALTKKMGPDAVVTKETLRSYSEEIDVIVSATANGVPHRTRFSTVKNYFWAIEDSK